MLHCYMQPEWLNRTSRIVGKLGLAACVHFPQVFEVYAARLERDCAVARSAEAMDVLAASAEQLAQVLISNLVVRGQNTGKQALQLPLHLRVTPGRRRKLMHLRSVSCRPA